MYCVSCMLEVGVMGVESLDDCVCMIVLLCVSGVEWMGVSCPCWECMASVTTSGVNGRGGYELVWELGTEGVMLM